jgi:hypothetical protein
MKHVVSLALVSADCLADLFRAQRTTCLSSQARFFLGLTDRLWQCLTRGEGPMARVAGSASNGADFETSFRGVGASNSGALRTIPALNPV